MTLNSSRPVERSSSVPQYSSVAREAGRDGPPAGDREPSAGANGLRGIEQDRPLRPFRPQTDPPRALHAVAGQLVTLAPDHLANDYARRSKQAEALATRQHRACATRVAELQP